MPYTISCQCGKNIEVTASQSGSTVICDCGQTVNVPSMSALRTSAGESAIPLNIVERIHGMVHREELPQNAACPISGQPTETIVWAKVQCERTYATKGDPKTLRELFAVAASYLSIKTADRDTVGRNVSVNVPLAIATDQQARFLGTKNQTQLKEWLSKTPIYQELLEEYPEATITTFVP